MTPNNPPLSRRSCQPAIQPNFNNFLNPRGAMKKLFTVVILTSFLMALHDARATTYIYSGTNTLISGTDQWASHTNWTGSGPLSGATTVLEFLPTGTYASGATIDTNDNLSGTFQLKQIQFSGTGPGGAGHATVTISGSAGAVLGFQGASPSIGALNPSSLGNMIYIFTIPINTGTMGTSGTMNLSTAGGLSYTLAGSLSGSDTITKTGGAQLTISGTSNSWVGDFQASGGITTINGPLSGATSVEVSTGNSLTTFTVNGLVNTGATIQVLSGSEVATLSGTGTVGAVVLNGGSNGGSNVVSSAATLTTGGITVNGTSNFISSGTVNAGGGTTINSGGSLAVNSTLGGGGTVNAGGVLSGTGTLTGATAVNGALTPGTGTGGGTLKFASGLTIGNGATLNYGLGSTGDLVAVTGNLTLSCKGRLKSAAGGAE